MAFLSGKSLIGVCTAVTLLLVVAAMFYAGDYLAALPYVMKPTAHFAFALFWVAFTASSIHRLWPGAYSRWAMRNRRYIGLSFAAVHFVHLALVLSNITMTEDSRPVLALAGGGLAYVFLALMAVTSNTASVRMLGAGNWRRLHLVGSWYIWAIFMYGTPDILNGNMVRIWITVFGLLALVLRLVARNRKPGRSSARALS